MKIKNKKPFIIGTCSVLTIIFITILAYRAFFDFASDEIYLFNISFLRLYGILTVIFFLLTICDIYISITYRNNKNDIKKRTGKLLILKVKTTFFTLGLTLSPLVFMNDFLQNEYYNATLIAGALIFYIACDRVVANLDKIFEIMFSKTNTIQKNTQDVSMKMCNTEIMKKIELLEQQKTEVESEEMRIYAVTYQTEKDKFDNGYDFASTRQKIDDIDAEVRKYKRLLNYSNATTIIAEFDMTLGECLVYMAQLNSQLYTLRRLAQQEPITRRSTVNGVIEHTALNYDIKEYQAKLQWVQETIAALQVAIDRTNLTNMIKIN